MIFVFKKYLSLIYQKQKIMKKYSLIENGVIHTSDLSLSEANEMLARHKRFFPEIDWHIELDANTKSYERGVSFMDRQKRAYRSY